jgi:esterase/lipase
MAKINFISNGFTLSGNVFKGAESAKLAFLFIQGWMGHQNILAAQKLASMGFTSMTYDMRGNGESDGNLADFSRADFISDAVNAYDYLKLQAGNGIKIGVVGSSFGSYTAVLLSGEREVECLSLRVPATYPDEGFTDPHLPQVGSEALHAWRRKEQGYEENRAFRALHAFTGDVQIVEAGDDEVVPHQAPQNYANALADKGKLDYVIMTGAPHSLVNDKLQHEYEQLLAGWVKSLKLSKTQ